MSRRLLLVTVGVLVVAAAVPAATSAQAPLEDSVTGEVNVFGHGQDQCGGPPIPDSTCPLFSLTLDARSAADGANPSGTVQEGFNLNSRGATHVDADVTCLSIRGNVAIVGALGYHSGLVFAADFYPIAVVMRVVDGGGPGSGLDSWETLASQSGDPFDPSVPPPPAPTNCSSFLGQPVPGGGSGDYEGDLTVIDAPALPTSLNQCKNGGWRNFPGFKNQGQCLVFVLKTRLCQFLERFGHHPKFCPARLPGP